MSNSVEIWDTVVSQDEAVEFLNAKGVSTGCARCEHKSFTIGLSPPEGGEYIALVTIKSGDSGGLGENHIPAFTISCRNCGSTQFYSATPLIEWLTEKRKGEATDD